MSSEQELVYQTIDAYLNIFGNRWNLLILYQLFNGPKRFNELKRALDPISQTVLTRHLKTLQNADVIDREVFPTTPISVVYSISRNGYTVIPSMVSTYSWINEFVLNRSE